MRTPTSKRIVIDACIAQQSTRCRYLLKGVLDICHHLALSRATSEEWRRHQTEYSTKWRRWMTGKKKVDVVSPVVDDGFRERVTDSAHSKNAAAALRKDLPIVEAAMASDGIVISLDNAARALMRDAARSCPELRDIVWLNPEEMGEADLLAWLRDGAPSRQELTLGATEEGTA